MLRFRLGNIPIEVHPSHLLVAALLAYQPGRSLPEVAVWVAIISFSVLFHELGHALVSLAFGYRPSIQLAWLGGNTQPHAEGPITWWRDILLTLAGPGFGLLLATAAAFGMQQTERPSRLHGLLGQVAWVNIVWSIMNLFPILPLDGGRVSHALLTRVFGRRGTVAAWGASALLSAGVVLLALKRGDTWLVMMFAMFGIQAGRVTASLLQAPLAAGADPDLLARALEHYKEGRLPEAKQAAQALLEAEPPPQIRSRAAHLLGWIALKEGEGRAALDHFSLVTGGTVEKEALAAAFSLLGDDARALPLWELAYRDGANAGHRSLLHEWAGTLLRMGRPEDAARLTGVDLAAAYTCAERVLYLRGKFAEAAEAGVQAFKRSPGLTTAYDIACAYARAGQAESALHWLQVAAGQGFQDGRHAATDPDLALLHGRPDFEAWRASLRKVVVS